MWKWKSPQNIGSIIIVLKTSFKKTLFIVSSGEIKPPEQLQSTCDENQFQKDLVGTRPRTSSPIDFRSLIRDSVLLDTTAFQDCPNDPLPDLRGWRCSFNQSKRKLVQNVFSWFQDQLKRGSWERSLISWTRGFCATSSKVKDDFMVSRCSTFQTKS